MSRIQSPAAAQIAGLSLRTIQARAPEIPGAAKPVRPLDLRPRQAAPLAGRHGSRVMSKNLYRRGAIWWGRVTIAGTEHRRSLRTRDRIEAGRRLKAWKPTLNAELTSA
jgi:hypothetical protein